MEKAGMRGRELGKPNESILNNLLKRRSDLEHG